MQCIGKELMIRHGTAKKIKVLRLILIVFMYRLAIYDFDLIGVVRRPARWCARMCAMCDVRMIIDKR